LVTQENYPNTGLLCLTRELGNKNYPSTEKITPKNDPKGSTQDLGRKNNPILFREQS